MPEFDRLEIAWKINLCPNTKRMRSPIFFFQGLKFNFVFELKPQEECKKDCIVLYIQGVHQQPEKLKDFIINSYLRNTSGKKFFFSTKLVTHPLNPSCQIIWEVNRLLFMSISDDLVEKENGVEKIIINCSLRSGTETSGLDEKLDDVVCSAIKTLRSDICSVDETGKHVEKKQENMFRSQCVAGKNKVSHQDELSNDEEVKGDFKETNCVNYRESASYYKNRAPDIVLTYKDVIFPVHKVILAARRKQFLKHSEELNTSEISVFHQDELSNDEEVEGDFEETSCVNYRESASYYKNREPDIVLTCKDVIFPVHKAILAARCKQFLKHIEELDTSEISDMHPSTLEYFLQYVYSGSLQCLSHESICLQLYDSGFKYGLEELAKLCADMLIKGPDGGVTRKSFCEFLALVYKHKDEDTKYKIMCDYNNLMTFFRSKEWSEYSRDNVDLSISLTQTILLLQNKVYSAASNREDFFSKYFK